MTKHHPRKEYEFCIEKDAEDQFIGALNKLGCQYSLLTSHEYENVFKASLSKYDLLFVRLSVNSGKFKKYETMDNNSSRLHT